MVSLNEWEGSLSEQQLLCRDSSIHHSWEPYTAHRIDDGYERSLQCERCKTIKIQRLDLMGYVVSTRMVYVEGYLRPKGSGRITQTDNARMRLLGVTPTKRRRKK